MVRLLRGSMRDWCRNVWIMVWLFMGLGFGCVVAGRVSGEYDVQFSGFLERGVVGVCGCLRHSRNVCV